MKCFVSDSSQRTRIHAATCTTFSEAVLPMWAEREARAILAAHAGMVTRGDGQCFAEDVSLQALAQRDGERVYDSLGSHRFRAAAIEALSSFLES